MRFLAAALVVAAALAGCAAPAEKNEAPEADPWAGTGFSVWDAEGRWVVFREGSKDLGEFRKSGELAKSVTRVGAGPGGRTVKAPDAETLDAFAAWRPGFSIRTTKEGRILVFKEKSKELAEFDKAGDLAKSVTRVGAGPGGATLRAPDAETLDAWAAAR